MAFGILEDHKLDSIPGTGILSTKAGRLSTDETKELKHGTGKYSHIVLIPQSSDDPCDPNDDVNTSLNWPRWKEACFWILVFTTSITDSLPRFTNSGFFQLAKQFHVSVDEVASSFNAILPGSALFVLLQNPIAVRYGHRIVYLLPTFFMLVSCFWTALSPDLAYVRASRVVQGFGHAASKCLMAVTIEHLYFVHERGSRSCMFTILEWIGSMAATMTNGYVIQRLSWQLGFWFICIVSVVGFFGVFVFVPETTYHRQASPVILLEPTKRAHPIDRDNVKKPSRKPGVEICNVDCNLNSSSSNTPGLLSQLKIYNGTFSDDNFWKLFLRPFPFILSPVAWFVFLSYTIPSCFQICTSTIFTVAYGFDASQTALTNVGSVVGVIVAMVITGPLNDWWVIWMSRRNGGVYEPEHRLAFMLSMLVGVFGYIGWAIGNDRHMHWVGAVACLAMIYFSVVVSGTARLAYLIDTHDSNTLHIMVLTECARNLLSYGASFFVNGIILSVGVKRTLLVLGACKAALFLPCIPMYVYGKRVRSFIARHPRLFRGDLPASDEEPRLRTTPLGGPGAKH